MSLEAIKALPVERWAARDCVLFLWAVNPMLPQALETIAAWGFKFQTVAFTWAKRTPTGRAWHVGLGYWTRQNTEQVLLATRGSPTRESKSVAQLIVARRREHSRKPDDIHDRTASLVAGPRLEMFARETPPKWWGDGIGDQMGMFV